MAKKSGEKAEKEEKTEKVDVKKAETPASAQQITGRQGNAMAAIAYLLTFITGAIIYLVTDKKDKYTRFHALQAVLYGIVLIIVIFIAVVIDIVLGIGLSMVAGPLSCICCVGWILIVGAPLVLTLYLMYQAYSGVMFKLPVLGDFAEKHV